MLNVIEIYLEKVTFLAIHRPYFIQNIQQKYRLKVAKMTYNLHDSGIFLAEKNNTPLQAAILVYASISSYQRFTLIIVAFIAVLFDVCFEILWPS